MKSLIVLAVSIAISLACRCIPPTTETTYCSADYIGRVKITSMKSSEDKSYIIYGFKEVKKYKGNGTYTKFQTPSHSATCGISSLKVGQEYLLPAKLQKAVLTANTCLGFPVEDNHGVGPLEWEKVPQTLKDVLEKNPPKC
ncbi:unnamed protein product [Bursaphelenchus okinawaensis]|uniref:NTR domain-containing protein n=1 Tax=Bursaphelenchus okinawaensis TaxID=465554 RepID=A0A811L739_9BILA|nr:unnamed protein product [Bursaphelenchus okinawaensis]CAG9117056.1 unnamed protein product [Bursaphelenchus okinawaensis]